MTGNGVIGGTFRSPPIAAVRLRPWLPQEDVSQQTVGVASSSSSVKAAVEIRAQGQSCLYPSHFVFSPNHPQAAVYKELMTDIIGEAIASGRGGSIVACGPPGSGKSHTLLGYGSDPGLIPHATLDIFRSVSGGGGKLKVWCSYFEVHHGLTDLLAPLPDPRLEETSSGEIPLEVVELRGSSAHICGLAEVYVESIAEVQELVDYGHKRRVALEKLCHVHGRSHTVFTFNLAWEEENGGLSRPQRSRISFVDCASAQGFKDPSLQGLSEALKDLALGGARARGLGKAFFRRSLLTQLLEDALLGKEQLVLLTTLAPGSPENEACDYLDLVQAVMDASNHSMPGGDATRGSSREYLAMLQLEIEALQKYVSPDERACEDKDFKAARLCALQRVLEERCAKMAPVEEQAAARLALRKAQKESLIAWGFASEQEMSMAPCLLLRLHSDPMLTGSLAHVISGGSRVLGSASEICLKGLGIVQQHCQIAEHSGGLWLTNLCSQRHRLFVNGRPMDGTSAEPLRHGDRLQVGWAVELLVVDVTDQEDQHCPEVKDELWTRPLGVLVEEANELLRVLGHAQTPKRYKYFEAVDPTVNGEEDLVRLRRKSEAAEEAVTFWPVEELRVEVKRLQDLYCSPSPIHEVDVPKDGRSKSVVLSAPPFIPSGKVESAIPSDYLVTSQVEVETQVDPPERNFEEVHLLKPTEGLAEEEPSADQTLFQQVEREPSADVLLQKEQAMAASLQRAHHLSQCIGETVSALQETVAELRRSASGSFPVAEAFEKLQLDNHEMKQRLHRLESHLVPQPSLKDASSQRSSAAVPSEPSTGRVLSGRVVIPRIRYEVSPPYRPSLSGRATSPIPIRSAPGVAASMESQHMEPVTTRHSWHASGSFPVTSSPIRRSVAYRVHLEAMPKTAAVRRSLTATPLRYKVPLVPRSPQPLGPTGQRAPFVAGNA